MTPQQRHRQDAQVTLLKDAVQDRQAIERNRRQAELLKGALRCSTPTPPPR